MLFTNQERNCFAKDPAVVKFHGTYFLYYTFHYTEEDKIGVAVASSEDMEHWTCTEELPLSEAYEQNGIGAPAAIVLDEKVHLFYQTYGNGRNDAICHAVSEDGIHFVKNPDNPVYAPTKDWCCGRAIDADVCIFKGKLFLYIATRDHDMKIQKLGGAWAPLDSDFSRTAWTQTVPGAILSPEMQWEGLCIEAPATVVNRDQMFLFYGGSYNCTPQQIGVAVSDDGVYFRKLSSTPFMPCGKPGTWNSSESGHPYVFRDEDGLVYLFYQGSADMGKTWYLSRVRIDFDEKNIPYIVG